MKKITHTVKQQRRRQGALDRFSIDPKRQEDSAYRARKEQELTTLKTRLGV